MTSNEILSLAHREAWRYKKSSDSHHSDTYTFNRSTLLEFARKLVSTEREACAKTCEDLWQEEATAAVNGNQNPKYHDCIECAHAIRERSNRY